MTTDFDRDMQRVCEPFERDHERLRAELMASLPAEQPEAQGLDRAAGRRLRIGSLFMRRRILSISIAAAVAAAVILAVGLWPEGGENGRTGGSGRVYALSDIPGLLRSAKVLHLHEWFYVPNATEGPPGVQRRKIEADYWLDTVGGRWHLWYTDRGLSDGVPPTEEQKDMTYRFLQQVSDGEFAMDLWHDAPVFRDDPSVAKKGEFSRLTPFMRVLKIRDYYPWVTAFADRFRNAKDLGRFSKVGQENLEGTDFEIWESEYDVPRWDKAEQKSVYDGVNRGRTRVWLSPVSGAVGRLEHWHKGPTTNGLWEINGVTDKVERDVEPPSGVFDTVPPPEFVMQNTKETARLASLSEECDVLGFGDLEVRLHILFTLNDGSILFGWSSRDKKSAESQAPLFADLFPGGPLPKLPIEIQALVPENPDCDLVYTGRHLAWTQKDDRFYEWGLYVPQRELRSPQERCARWFDFRYAVNSDNPTAANREPLGHPVSGPSVYVVGDPAEFNELVLGAMADLSDGGVPEDVTFENVTALCGQIRASLESN